MRAQTLFFKVDPQCEQLQSWLCTGWHNFWIIFDGSVCFGCKKTFNPPLCAFFFFLETGHNITEPEVKVLGPAENECREKTLVCVAEGFYPDHITMSWQINGKNQKDNVATDSKAERVGRHYRISSRLTVPATSWFKEGTRFTCIVIFYNGEKYIQKEAEAFGIRGAFESRQSENVVFVGPDLTPVSFHSATS